MVEYTYTFHEANNIRPDVRPEMFLIAANDTPLLATLGDRPVDAKIFTWQMEDLANPTSVKSPEAESTVTASSVTGGRPQMSGLITKYSEDFNVSNTLRSVSQYGVDDEYYYKAQKVALKLAKEFEVLLHWGTHAAYDTTTSAPGTVGVIKWLLETGALRSSGAASGTVGLNTVPAAYFSVWRDCKKQNTSVLTEDLFNQTIGQAWSIGTSISDLIGFCGADVKRRLSNFNLVYNTGATTSAHTVSINRTHQAEMKRRQVSMDFYESDFGAFGVVLDRYMNSSFSLTATGQATTADNFVAGGDDSIFFIDPAYWAKAVLRPLGLMHLAPTDDSKKGYVVGEMGLECGNPKAGFGISQTDNV